MRYLSLFFTLVFVLQASVWAMAPKDMKPFVKKLNSLSLTEKQQWFADYMKERPKNDQEFIKKQKIDFSMPLPSFQTENGLIVFHMEKKKITLLPHPHHKIEINGKMIDLSPGKFETAYYDIEKLFNSESVSMLDFLIPSAHASFLLWTSVFVAAVGVSGLWSYYEYDPRSLSKRHCAAYKFKLDKVKVSSNPEEIKKLQEEFQNEIWKIISYAPECRPTNGSQRDGVKCQADYAQIKCLEDAKKELESLSAVNTSGREVVKEVEEQKSSSENKTKSKAE